MMPSSVYERLRLFGVSEEEMKEPVLTKPTEPVNYSTALIRKELECPICLRIMKEPVISRSCGHVYCKECIEKYIRQDKLSKKCPSCRISITNRRHLVREPILEQLIKTAFPDLDDYLKREEDVTMKFAKKREVAEHVGVPVAPSLAMTPPTVKSDEKVDFMLEKDPESDLRQIEEPYVRVTGTWQVASLWKLIQQLIAPGDPMPRLLWVRSHSGERIPLVKDMRLREVKDFWDPENEDSWVIFYS